MKTWILTLAFISLVVLGRGSAARAQEAAEEPASADAAEDPAAVEPAEPERQPTKEDDVAPLTTGGNVPPEVIQDPELGLELVDERQVPGAAARRAKHQELLARWQAAGPEERQAIMNERLETWKALSNEQRVSIRNRYKVRWAQRSLAERDAIRARLVVPEEPIPAPRPPENGQISRRAQERRESFERRKPKRFERRLPREEDDDDDDED